MVLNPFYPRTSRNHYETKTKEAISRSAITKQSILKQKEYDMIRYNTIRYCTRKFVLDSECCIPFLYNRIKSESVCQNTHKYSTGESLCKLTEKCKLVNLDFCLSDS